MKEEEKTIINNTENLETGQIQDLVLNFGERENVNFYDLMQFRSVRNRLTTKVVKNFLDTSELPQTFIQQKRREVIMYMVDQTARQNLKDLGQFLLDLTEIRDTIIFPETEPEMSCLMSMVLKAKTTGKPITLCTPICPDWSQDSMGRYDFKSLGGKESFIGKKFFAHSTQMLEVFSKHKIPFQGVILFADWGLETEIDAKDTYGQKLSSEDVKMCFQSTFAKTDEHLSKLQQDEKTSHLFAPYKMVSMDEFLTERLDIPSVQKKLNDFFKDDRRGIKLVETLSSQSFLINSKRLGVSEEENKELTLRNLVEYATVGQSLDNHSIFMVCESRTSSRCYNMPRDKRANVPVFYLKGSGGADSGVNML